MHRVDSVLNHVQTGRARDTLAAAVASAGKGAPRTGQNSPPERARLWAVDAQIQAADGLCSMEGRPPKLLSDAQIIEFIKKGFIVLPLPELSPDFHAKCADSIMDPWEKNSRNNNWIGNNIFPGNANLGSVLAAPTVRGALTSVLGPDYALHLHRALHVSGDGGEYSMRTQKSSYATHHAIKPRGAWLDLMPSIADQGFHKDTPEGGGPVRHMRPRWVSTTPGTNCSLYQDICIQTTN